MSRQRIAWAQSDSRLPAIQELTKVANYDSLDMCGPTAISAITGLPLRDVYYAIFRLRGYTPESVKPVYGMPTGEVINVLGLLGYRADVFDVEPNPGKRITIRSFIDRGDDQPACIVVTKNHFVAMDWGIVIDNHTAGLEATIDELWCKNHSVINYIEVRKVV